MKLEAGQSPSNRLSQQLLENRVKVTLVARPLLTPVAKNCAGAYMMHSREERVFILEHYDASKSFAAVQEAFSNVYPNKEVPNKTTVHRLVTRFRNKEEFVRDKFSWSHKTAAVTAVLILTRASGATTICGCNNLTLPLGSSFCT
jgi:hypothetical protein